MQQKIVPISYMVGGGRLVIYLSVPTTQGIAGMSQGLSLGAKCVLGVSKVCCGCGGVSRVCM